MMYEIKTYATLFKFMDKEAAFHEKEVELES
jgi:hypothetical protein